MFRTELLSNGVALLRMQHGKVNEMDLEFCQAISNEFARLAADVDCRALILASSHKVFSAGVDLVRLSKEPVSYLDTFLPALTGMFQAAFEFPKPLIASINGAAIAGGCVMASASDYRVISSNAKIGIPELRVGVPLPTIGFEIMRSVTTPKNFRQMVLTGATFAGTDAVNVGLADEVCDSGSAEGSTDLIEKACLAVAQRLTFIPATVYELSKEQLRQKVVDRIRIGEEKFGSRIRDLWYDDEVRNAVKDYVAERLS